MPKGKLQAKAALDAMNGEVTSAAAGFSAESSDGSGDSSGGGSGPTTRTGASLGGTIWRQPSVRAALRAVPQTPQSLDLRSFLLFPLHLPF